MSDNKYDTKGVVFHIARTRRDLEESFSLVYKEYAQRKLIPKGYKSKLRLSIFNALPSTTTFVAKKGERVLATVTLVCDSPMGILMDKLFKEEVDGLRTQGHRVAEVSGLSIATELFGKGIFSMFNFNKLSFVFKLFKLVLDYATYIERLDDLCIAIVPKHQHLYKFLNFEELGKLKYYGTFNTPAIAKRVDLHVLAEKTKKRNALYKIFFDKKTDFSVFKDKYKLTPEDLKYFFVKKSDVFKKADIEQLQYIKSCYPGETAAEIFKKIGV